MFHSDVVTVLVGRLAPLVARGVVAALESDQRFCVLEQDVTDNALHSEVMRHSPQIVVLDPAVEYRFLAKLKSHRPTPALVVLAENPTRLLGTTLLLAGVTCLVRTASEDELLSALSRAARGEPTFLAADGYRVTGGLSIPPGLLSRREGEVLVQLSLGRSYAAIAHDMGIAPETVRKHTSNLCRKLNVKTRLQLPHSWPLGVGDHAC